MWWFFTLIMVSSYTANLAAFLTFERPSPVIESVDDLVAGKVKYGAKAGGSTLSFFRDSENVEYNKMAEYMANNPHLMTTSNEEGLEKAKAGKYAFLMESSTIEYITQRHCQVVQVGNKLDEKGYGIAMKKSKENVKGVGGCSERTSSSLCRCVRHKRTFSKISLCNEIDDPSGRPF